MYRGIKHIPQLLPIIIGVSGSPDAGNQDSALFVYPANDNITPVPMINEIGMCQIVIP
jgi:hypothetical protein